MASNTRAMHGIPRGQMHPDGLVELRPRNSSRKRPLSSEPAASAPQQNSERRWVFYGTANAGRIPPPQRTDSS